MANEFYEVRRIRISPRAWPRVIEEITTQGAKRVDEAGGLLYGLFTPQIGLPANEGIVITHWPGAGAEAPTQSPVTEGITDVLEASVERLVATVRPTEPVPASKGGVYAHRWFELKETDWPEFVSLSEAAWPDFEGAFECEVHGFWRSLEASEAKARVLLLTNYSSLAVWERSRRPTSAAGERFARRHQLTEYTVVVTTQLRSA